MSHHLPRSVSLQKVTLTYLDGICSQNDTKRLTLYSGCPSKQSLITEVASASWMQVDERRVKLLPCLFHTRVLFLLPVLRLKTFNSASW